MLKNWINIFLYHFRNNMFFTTLNIVGLSMGIAGLIFAILYWNDEQSYNAWNPEKDKVFQVIVDIGDQTIWSSMPEPVGELIAAEPEIDQYCYSDGWYHSAVFYYGNKKEIVEKVYQAQENFFSFFPFEFKHGNPKTALKENTIVLSESTAERLFGVENPMGKRIRIDQKEHTVTGVYQIKGNSSIAPQAVVSNLKWRLEENKGQWGNFNFTLLLKLKSPKDSAVVAKKLNRLFYVNRTLYWAKEEGISPEEYIKKYGQNKIMIEPISTARLHSRVDGHPEGKGNYQFLMIMMGLSVLILVLSIVNYVNLSTANAIKRAKEVGIRKIIGASKANIVFQFLFETIIITIIAILLSLVIVELSLPYYNEFLGKKLMIHSSQFYVQLIAIFLVTVLLAGIFPAIYVANFESLKVIKGSFDRSKSGIWIRNGMLILQFAIATFFIIGSYIVYEQINYFSNKDLGFKAEQVIQINYNNTYNWREEGFREKLYSRYHLIKHEIQKIKGVKKVSTGAFTFSDGANSSSSYTYKDITIQGQNMGIDFDMIDMMKIQIVQGRNLSSSIASDSIDNVLINEKAVALMNEKNPLGKEIDWNKKLKIVGIVKDFHVYGPDREIPPMTFFHFKTVDWMIQNVNKIYVKVDTQHLEETLTNIEKFWVKNIDTEYPFTYDFVDKAYARTYETYTKQRNLFSLLNVIVIIIALFGLFSLASFSIQRRMKEIAIRKTLGAETNVLLKELSKQYIIFCVIGFAIALFPVYYLLNKWLENFVYRIAISGTPFIVGFFVLMFLTLVVVLSKAYQATKVDVLKYLKYE